jgi:hypothetical protein
MNDAIAWRKLLENLKACWHLAVGDNAALNFRLAFLCRPFQAIGMKHFPGIMKCGAVATAAFCLLAISECQDRKHNAILTADHVIIPGTEISPEDADRLIGILKNSNDHFYRIQPFQNATPQTPFGKLSELKIDKDLLAEMDKNGRSTGFSRWTRVMGLSCFTRCQPKFVRQTHRSEEEVEELIRQVTPILQKYSKK